LRLLVDECLSAVVTDQLAHAGHDAVHVTAVGLAGRSDREVMAPAVKQQRIIISADTDFDRGPPRGLHGD
jgi:predicted nuclease of predicted toxin-antitoxin system